MASAQLESEMSASHGLSRLWDFTGSESRKWGAGHRGSCLDHSLEPTCSSLGRGPPPTTFQDSHTTSNLTGISGQI